MISEATKPVRIQLRRTKGWKMPPNTVKVDRTTKWGNPFVVGKPGGAYTAKVMDRRHAYLLFKSIAADNIRCEDGHDWQSVGGCNCSVPVNRCSRCGDWDYGENDDARRVRENCTAERTSR